MKRNHAESRLQQACVKWFRYSYPKHLIFSIPNGGARSRIEAAIMKGEGVTAGIPDLFIAAPRISDYKEADYHGLFIELKSDTGKLSPVQREVVIWLSVSGYQVSVCRSVEEFIKVVNEYLKAQS